MGQKKVILFEYNNKFKSSYYRSQQYGYLSPGTLMCQRLVDLIVLALTHLEIKKLKLVPMGA